MSRKKIAVQLYSLREDTAKDFKGVLKKVSEIGYDGVEFAGYGGISASEMKKTLVEYGLEVAGSHVSSKALLEDFNKEADYLLEIGGKYMICPWAETKTRNDLDELIPKLDVIGAKCVERRLVFAYHNHDTELNYFDGKPALDIMAETILPSRLQLEIDLYWVTYAGIDAVEYYRKHSMRCPLAHFKDMKAGPEKQMTEVGTGIIDYASIARLSADSITEWYVVEQDEITLPHFESIRISLENIKSLIYPDMG